MAKNNSFFIFLVKVLHHAVGAEADGEGGYQGRGRGQKGGQGGAWACGQGPLDDNEVGQASKIYPGMLGLCVASTSDAPIFKGHKSSVGKGKCCGNCELVYMKCGVGR